MTAIDIMHLSAALVDRYRIDGELGGGGMSRVFVARDEKLDRLLLHASVNGRALYERLGFMATNEMRFAGDSPATT